LPPKAAQSLIQQCAQAKVVPLPAGHSLMTEAPDGVLQALRDFLQ
jgi:pimeloyl-ACP methyl ester carboxylesterase